MKKEARLLRIGVLGSGPIAQFAHFDACRKAANAELYAICDVAEDLLTRMAAMHAPRVIYREFDEMLNDPQVDAVIIAIADQFHVPCCLKAIDAGKHVLIEKQGNRLRYRRIGLNAQCGNAASCIKDI
jgi:predicted dehydrogenase